MFCTVHSSKVRAKAIHLHVNMKGSTISNLRYCLNMDTMKSQLNNCNSHHPILTIQSQRLRVARPAWAAVGTWRFKTSSVLSNTFSRKAGTGPFCWLDIHKDVVLVEVAGDGYCFVCFLGDSERKLIR